jgi:hypothetical protein
MFSSEDLKLLQQLYNATASYLLYWLVAVVGRIFSSPKSMYQVLNSTDLQLNNVQLNEHQVI